MLQRTKLFKKKSARRPALLYIFSDGGLRPTPPAASSAVVVKDERGQVVDWSSRLLPPVSSCEAEYEGLLDALKLAERFHPRRACFHLDSQIVVGQVTGRFTVRQPRLKPFCEKIRAGIARLNAAGIETEFYFIPREYNLLADALASDALLLEPHAARTVYGNIQSKVNLVSHTKERSVK